MPVEKAASKQLVIASGRAHQPLAQEVADILQTELVPVPSPASVDKAPIRRAAVVSPGNTGASGERHLRQPRTGDV